MIFTMFILTACWSSRELNELAIAVGVGIDKADDGYMVTIQLVNPGELDGKTRSGRSEVLTVRMEGETVFEAFRKLTTFSPRKIYVAHILQVVFGEEMAKEGIAEPLEFLLRDHEVRPNFFIAVAKGKTAFDILRVQTSLESIPAGKLFQTLENSEKNWAVTKTVKLDELMLNIMSMGKEPVLTGIHLHGNPEAGSKFSSVEKTTLDSLLQVGEIGVLKKDKLIGWLNSEESKGYNFITDNVNNSVTTIPYNDGKIAIETIRTTTKMKGKVKEGKPKIDLFVSIESNIGEVLTKVDLLQEETIINIEKTYKKYIEKKYQ